MSARRSTLLLNAPIPETSFYDSHKISVQNLLVLVYIGIDNIEEQQE